MMADPTKQVDLRDPTGPSVWQAAEHAKGVVPTDAWEYQMRKALNDAAYNNLDYVPYSPKMPVPAKEDKPAWMWVRSCCACPKMQSSALQDAVSVPAAPCLDHRPADACLLTMQKRK
eukprot:GHRR01036760.1.p1 GENE.GHRR01036760.1~~GHRR01036760.1.p1  ORF type:complete len:117 (-),score=0.52 GHRR01036760.1:29-379(-)